MVNREHATTWHCGIVLACTLAAGASLPACGEDAGPNAPFAGTDDPIAAYEALSIQLEACEEREAACTAAAGGDPAQLAACDSAADGCKAEAAPTEARAKDSMRRGADRCRDEDDAGTAEEDAGPGGGDRHGCIERRFPNLQKCVRGLVQCLDDADFFGRNATREQVDACFEGGHACFIEELSAWRASRRDRGRDRHRDQNEASAGSAGDVNGAAAGGSGRSGSDDDEADRGERGHRDGPFDRRRQRRGRSN